MGSDDDYLHRHRHHISHKVTLAAVSSLFAATLLVILLFLYVKYRQNRNLHRRRVDFVSRMITAQSDRPDPSKAPVGGLDPAVLNSLPVTVCRGSEGAFECSVCLAQVVEGVSLRLLPNCGHSFHVNCVDTWLASHTTCPLCRAEVEPPPPPQTVVVSVDPTAPPVDEMSLLRGESSAEGKQAGGSRLSSFRRMLSRGRSLEACGDSAAAAAAPAPPEVVLARQ